MRRTRFEGDSRVLTYGGGELTRVNKAATSHTSGTQPDPREELLRTKFGEPADRAGREPLAQRTSYQGHTAREHRRRSHVVRLVSLTNASITFDPKPQSCHVSIASVEPDVTPVESGMRSVFHGFGKSANPNAPV